MRVGELATLTGVSVRSLRYYEQQGLLDPGRSPAGHRVYGDGDRARVARIQELFRAGFCSSVIEQLLPALVEQPRDDARLRDALTAAQARLESERRAVEAELAELHALRDRLGLAPDTGVTPHDEGHAPEPGSPGSPAAAADHRDRRLR